MPLVNVKSVMLYNKNRLRPQTLDAISNAKDMEWIPVDPSELDQVQHLIIFEPEVGKAKKVRVTPAKPPEPANGD